MQTCLSFLTCAFSANAKGVSKNLGGQTKRPEISGRIMKIKIKQHLHPSLHRVRPLLLGLCLRKLEKSFRYFLLALNYLPQILHLLDKPRFCPKKCQINFLFHRYVTQPNEEHLIKRFLRIIATLHYHIQAF